MDGINEGFTKEGQKTFYGATKLCSEVLLQEYMHNYGLMGVINRCGVVAGPGQFGKVDQGIFTFWMLAHYFKKNLQYIGFSGRGKQVRDMLHIDDLFELIDKQINSMSRISGKIYNVGGARYSNLSLQESTKICEEITGNRMQISRNTENRQGDIIIYITDNTAVRKDLEGGPKKKPREILNDIYKWIKKNEDNLGRIFI